MPVLLVAFSSASGSTERRGSAYFEPLEQGGGSSGQVLVSLPEETRRAVPREVRRDLCDTGGAIEIEVEYRERAAIKNSHPWRGHPRRPCTFELSRLSRESR